MEPLGGEGERGVVGEYARKCMGGDGGCIYGGVVHIWEWCTSQPSKREEERKAQEGKRLELLR